MSLIYAKTVQLQADVYDESSALTLMSSDIDRLATSLQAACEIWARAIEMAVGLWLLARQIGVSNSGDLVLSCLVAQMSRKSRDIRHASFFSKSFSD